MAHIIVPKPFGEVENGYPFMDLVKSPADAVRVFKTICATLERSFKEDERTMGRGFREKIQTQTEIDRRTEILCEWFRTLRYECGYSTSRALAVLPDALRAELNGGTFEPPRNDGMYSPSQGEA